MKNLKILFLPVLIFMLLPVFVFAQKQNVDIAKKIAESTPAALPQSPVVTKLMSDAQDKNLKGKIKSLIEYTEQPVGSPRKLSAQEYYNEAGNLIKSIDFTPDGFPLSVLVWGYLDGNRVNLAKDIEYAEGELPSSPNFIIGITSSSSSTPRDQRYTTKHIYRYENGSLAEEKVYQNNGEFFYRETYEVKDNRKVISNFSAGGDENSKTIEISDKNGNVIERDMLGANANDVEKEFTTYKFDSHGNWIEEQTSEQKKVKGKIVLAPLWKSYRTISHYP